MELFDFGKKILHLLLGSKEGQHAQGSYLFCLKGCFFLYTDFLKSKMVFHPSVECRTLNPSFIEYLPCTSSETDGEHNRQMAKMVMISGLVELAVY